jgi:hypothetical protein
LLAVAIALFLAAPAFAKTGTKSGGYWPYSSGIQGFVALGTVFTHAGDSPHSGYSTTTGKCKVCHAVHGAGSVDATGSTLNESEKLLRTTAADACTFCHLTEAFAVSSPYRGSPMLAADPIVFFPADQYQGDPTLTPDPIANYAGTEGGSGHFSDHQGSPYVGCPSCHAVHDFEAMIGTGENMLKSDPAKDVVSLAAVDGGYGSRKAAVTTMTDFCLDCHDGTQWIGTDGTSYPIVSSAEFSAQFPACAGGCHDSVSSTVTADNTQFGVMFHEGNNGRSHRMTEDLTGSDGSTQVANQVTLIPELEGPAGTSCVTCHKVETGGDFPHYISVDQDLIFGYTSVTEIDGVCLSCHSTVGTDY